IIKAAKERHIPIGPGRGSAAGSLVAWSLKITELDPLKYNLLFERFLNPERISMPDIDTDVSDKGREQLLKYITERYGSDRVSQIITFGRMKSRQAVKDVGRATGIEYALMDKTAKLIPADAKSIKEALERTPELKELYDNNQTIKNILITAEHIEGLARHASQHAAGVVITPVPITDLAPIRKIKDSGSSDNNDVAQTVTQYTMDAVEKVGLVKMDFLGLSTLSILEEALDNIRLNNKPVPDLNKISFEDPATYKILKEADTLGVFQLESDGIRSMLRKLKIDCFEDLITALAMYRPGPLNTGMVDQYIKCKHGEAEPEYPHIMLEKVLKETYGVILYQEQVMQCASILAGYTLGEADLLRRAMGKKKLEVMQKQRSKFLEGAAKNNIDEKKAGEIFDNIEKFAQYGFNKSHSAAYAVVTYDTANLKANYKSEFMAAYLSSQMKSKKEVLGHYVREVRKSGLDVLPPDINSSMESFTAVGSVIRFGLGAVSRMGHGAVEAIVKARESGGKFKSLWDFVQRIDISELNRASIENLIKAGAFDEILNNRARLINALPGHIAAAQALNNASKEQLSLFGEAEAEVISEPEVPEIADYDDHTRLDYEKEVTGLYISGHPFDMYENKIFKFANCKINDLSAWCED
nr:DNA polymerase III subunit alpha [Synergistaceae bacterium]